MRTFFAMLILAIPLAAQTTEPPFIPSDRSEAVYAIYSMALSPPSLSHTDDSKKYLIEDATGFNPDPDWERCLIPPADYQIDFEAIRADFAAHKSDSFRLERKLMLLKPYEILTAREAKRFEELTGNPSILGATREDVAKFRGGTDLIRLGNIYFNRNQTLALVRTGAWCGGLCGLWSWHVFEKKDDGHWTELRWKMCVEIASGPHPRVILADPPRVADAR